MRKYLNELQREGVVYLSDLETAESVLQASSGLIGKVGVFGKTIRGVKLTSKFRNGQWWHVVVTR